MSRLLKQYSPTQGIYIHIPHCLQKCNYCDFATVLLDKSPDLDSYVQLILQELDLKLLHKKKISSVYFGGGTPSLLGPDRIILILNHIKSLGYELTNNYEITLEINPGTLTADDILKLKTAGLNRFSVGVQTFNDVTLKTIGREHTSQQTKDTLKLLSEAKVAYTADLILALPNESFKDFKNNLDILLSYEPKHISAYILTVPEKSFLTQLMPKEDLLDELMNEAEIYLDQKGFERYEISNYRKKGCPPSLHNLLYWNDLDYWGVGVSAHSYFRDKSLWGTRFWNSSSMAAHAKQISKRSATHLFPPREQTEDLQLNESLTDYCFTHLRQNNGLGLKKLELKYSSKIQKLVIENLQLLVKNEYIEYVDEHWFLSKHGRKFADHVFRELCFSKEEMEN